MTSGGIVTATPAGKVPGRNHAQQLTSATPGIGTTSQPAEAGRSKKLAGVIDASDGSHIEKEVANISILHHVFLTFDS